MHYGNTSKATTSWFWFPKLSACWSHVEDFRGMKLPFLSIFRQLMETSIHQRSIICLPRSSSEGNGWIIVETLHSSCFACPQSTRPKTDKYKSRLPRTSSQELWNTETMRHVSFGHRDAGDRKLEPPPIESSQICAQWRTLAAIDFDSGYGVGITLSLQKENPNRVS